MFVANRAKAVHSARALAADAGRTRAGGWPVLGREDLVPNDLHLQPEGRRWQNDYGRQPRGEPRLCRAKDSAGGHGSTGKRNQWPWIERSRAERDGLRGAPSLSTDQR